MPKNKAKNKTIAICANTSWYILNFRRSTVEMLVTEGWEVHTIAGDDDYGDQLRDLGAVHTRVLLKATGTNPFIDFLTFIDLWWAYRFTPKVVINFTPKCNIYSALAAHLRGIPSINNISGMGSGTLAPTPVRFFLKLLYGLVSRIAAKTYFQNPEDQKYFASTFGHPQEKSELISGSGVNLEQFRYLPLSNGKNRVRFGMFTRLVAEKGVRHFVEAAQTLRGLYPVEFILAGSIDTLRPHGISLEEVHAWDQAGLISYLGMLRDVREEIAACDCIVLPSYYPEGTPRILIESAAIGRPIITTDHPGCRDTVTPESGFLIQTRSTASLVEAMVHFLKLPDSERLGMSHKGRIHAERYFDEVEILRSYSDSIKRIANI